jgi:hypothetical protein
MTDEELRTNEIAGKIWLELKDPNVSADEKDRLLSFIERFQGREVRERVEAKLKESA